MSSRATMFSCLILWSKDKLWETLFIIYPMLNDFCSQYLLLNCRNLLPDEVTFSCLSCTEWKSDSSRDVSFVAITIKQWLVLKLGSFCKFLLPLPCRHKLVKKCESIMFLSFILSHFCSYRLLLSPLHGYSSMLRVVCVCMCVRFIILMLYVM